MNEINIYIGGQIRKYRKANGMTLQQLADVIHKSVPRSVNMKTEKFPLISPLYMRSVRRCRFPSGS